MADLIDRHVLLNGLPGYVIYDTEHLGKAYNNLVNMIGEQPSVDAEPVRQWISCLDRLPDRNHDWVLVAVKLIPEGYYGVPCVAEYRGGEWWGKDCDIPFTGFDGELVTHWMELPKNPLDDGGAKDG